MLSDEIAEQFAKLVKEGVKLRDEINELKEEINEKNENLKLINNEIMNMTKDNDDLKDKKMVMEYNDSNYIISVNNRNQYEGYTNKYLNKSLNTYFVKNIKEIYDIIRSKTDNIKEISENLTNKIVHVLVNSRNIKKITEVKYQKIGDPNDNDNSQ